MAFPVYYFLNSLPLPLHSILPNMISRTKFPLLNILCYLSIFLYCSVNQLLLQTECSSNETDFVSLIAIKDRIQGGLSSWNESIHFCQWQGVTCSSTYDQRVIALNFSKLSLVGDISPHIGNLSFLRVIDLQNNNFYGEIPQEIGHLFRLREFTIANNTFGGEIPVNISQCTDLKILDLGGNNLSGIIPTQLGSLSNLAFLSIQENNLIGEISPSIGNLSSLEVLSLAENSLKGSIPDSLGTLYSLTAFLVSSNRLSGEVPPSIYNISSMNLFAIYSNQFTGTLPPDIGTTLPNLLSLAAGGNQLSGSLPMSFTNASKLQVLDLPGNNFTGQVPTNLGAMQNIFRLNFGHNNLGRGETHDLSFITSLTNLSILKWFSLTSNNFGGVLPDSISNLSTKIEQLYLGGNQISGIIPEGIGSLFNLIGLGLSNNHIHGNIPSSLENTKGLQVLYLHDNNLTGFISSSLANLTQLSFFDLSRNRLEGSIPSSFGGFQHLRSLRLRGNNLNSAIPRQIFGISSLSILLDLSQNSFSGSLPLELGNLKNLMELDVSGNKLAGEIPSTIGNCLSMEVLNLEKNLFEGTIPQSLSSLRNIRYIDLSRNNLSGRIPTYMENFPYLQRVNLSFNKFEGEVPVEGIFKNTSSTSVAGNVELCGGIQELKLQKCQSKDTKKHGKPLAFKIAIALSLGLFFVVVSFFLTRYWKRDGLKVEDSSWPMKSQHLKISYKELFQATGGFAPTNVLGSGSFGCVYKGRLHQDEMIIAVKVFNLQRKGASKSFIAESESLRYFRHRNLVKIITSCSSMDFDGNDFQALVYQFMPNGSLEKWLHRDSEGQDAQSRKLNLCQRLNIAIDVSSALNYLHHQGHVSVIHRDLKPSNVLLDDDMVAHVSDFGLAKLISRSVDNPYSIQSASIQSASIGVKGSIGYAAPEYGMGCEASIQGDMYSYGILVLEMFTGKRPTDEMFKDGLNIHNYASNALPDQVMQIVDPMLLSGGRARLLECLTNIIIVGVSCSLETPSERMEDVSRELDLIRDTYLGTRIHEEERG